MGLKMKNVYIYQIVEPDCENAEHSFIMTDIPLPRWFFEYFEEIEDFEEDKEHSTGLIKTLIEDYNLRLFEFDDTLITKGVSSEVGRQIVTLIENLRKK